jgi:hypothetical protein
MDDSLRHQSVRWTSYYQVAKMPVYEEVLFLWFGGGIFDQYKTNAQTLDQALGN